MSTRVRRTLAVTSLLFAAPVGILLMIAASGLADLPTTALGIFLSSLLCAALYLVLTDADTDPSTAPATDTLSLFGDPMPAAPEAHVELNVQEQMALEIVFGMTEPTARRILEIDPSILMEVADFSPHNLSERLGVTTSDATMIILVLTDKLSLPYVSA